MLQFPSQYQQRLLDAKKRREMSESKDRALLEQTQGSQKNDYELAEEDSLEHQVEQDHEVTEFKN